MEKNIPKLIIRDCLRVREGELVQICSWPHTMELANQLAIECFKSLAVPLITLTTDEILEWALTEAPVEALGIVPEHEVAIAKSVDVYVHISGPADPSIMARASSERFRAFSAAGAKTYEALRQGRVRQANVHLGKITRERAERYKLEYSAWRGAVEDALAVDYGEMRALGEGLSERLLKGGGIRLLTDQGTDLAFQLDGRTIRLDDGVISDEDISRDLLSTNLPAGFLDAASVEGSGDGMVVVDTPQMRAGKIVEKTCWEFGGGRLTSMTAEKNVEVLEKMIESACPGEAVLGRFGIGLNAGMAPGYMFDELCRGRVTIAVGGSEGGECAITGVLRRPTVYVGDNKLVDKGTIKI